MVRINGNIFKAYDIRAVYPTDINEQAAFSIGKAFVKHFKCKEVVVGRDMRASSPSLFKALSAGIISEGAKVVDIGMCATPMLSFSVANYGYDCGIMISASHNPGEYNAFKLIGKKGVQISGDTGIEDIKELALAVEEDYDKEQGDAIFVKNLGAEKIIKKDVLEDYLAHHLKALLPNKGKKLKIVCDYGNGVGGISGANFFKRTDFDVISMYEDPDGSFPNHPANPMDFKTLNDIKNKVIDEKADVGFAFDGDADRCLVIDERGNIVMPDLLLAVLAREELEKHPKETVYYDLRFSKVVEEEIKKYGGTAVMMKVGNPFYKEKLINSGGILAGELSGHIMFKENFGIDDGLFAAIKFLNILTKENKRKKVSEMILPLRRYFGSEEINMRVIDPLKTLEEVKEAYEDGLHKDIDGVHVTYIDWWFSLRMSNTEPVVRLRLEANTQSLLDEKRDEIITLVRKSKIEVS